ncbi:hypothetical protein KGF36_19820 [Clostridioides sp. ZZV14-6009]|nr:hypothetical protein [Clostridioides sp. ZZV14-6009]
MAYSLNGEAGPAHREKADVSGMKERLRACLGEGWLVQIDINFGKLI